MSDSLREAAASHDEPHQVGGVVALETETGDLMREAADSIESLQAALQRIEDLSPVDNHADAARNFYKASDIASEALSGR